MRIHTALLALVTVFAPISAHAADSESKKITRVAVYDLSVLDVPERVGRVVNNALVAELRKLDGMSVVSMEEVRALLAHEGNRQSLGCSEGNSCVAELADALGVDIVVTGSLAHVGEESVMTLKRLDATGATPGGGADARLEPNDGEEFLASVGPLVEQLFADAPLRAGMTRGVDERLAAMVNPPPLPVWGTLAVGAVGVGLLGGAAAACVGTALAQSEYDRLVTLAQKEDVPGTNLVEVKQRGEALWLTSVILVAAGMAASIATVVMAPITDWSGAGAEEP